jgi:hypothetical protein
VRALPPGRSVEHVRLCGGDVAVKRLEVQPADIVAADMLAAVFRFSRRSMMTLPLIEALVSPVRWSDWFAANGLGRHPQAPMPALIAVRW